MGRGSTHRKGITATSWQIWLVVASSMMEAEVGSATHMATEPKVGLSPVSGCWSGMGVLTVRRSSARQTMTANQPIIAANARYARDHARACLRRERAGSKRNG